MDRVDKSNGGQSSVSTHSANEVQDCIRDEVMEE